jgi:hypothetical protein
MTQNLRIRFLEQIDLAAAEALLHPGFTCAPQVRSQIQQFWAEWRSKGMMLGAGVEDTALPAVSRLRLVGLTVFVDDSFLADLDSRPTAQLAARVYELTAAGQCPLLSHDEIVARNCASQGLNLLLLHAALCDYDHASPVMGPIINMGKDSFALTHGGYQYRSMIVGVHGTQQRDFFSLTGLRETLAEDGVPESHRAHVLQCTRDDLPVGAFISYFYWVDEPRFGLSLRQQQILQLAVVNESDEQIAESLGITAEGVRKHWRGIFDAIKAADPVFFPAEKPGEGRGLGKRRHVIHYLQSHLEELRPHCVR